MSRQFFQKNLSNYRLNLIEIKKLLYQTGIDIPQIQIGRSTQKIRKLSGTPLEIISKIYRKKTLQIYKEQANLKIAAQSHFILELISSSGSNEI